MYILIQLEDRIQISASELNNQKNALEESISKKYCDKVIKNTGLVISLKQILKVLNGKLMYGSGMANFTVTFTLILFRPLKGELMVGKIIESTKNGLKLSLDFFEDVYVPSYLLYKNSNWNEEEQLWYTNLLDENDNQEEKNKWWYALKSNVLFRVSNLIFNTNKKENQTPEESEPMVVIASVQEQGLGVVGWW